jgi:hypothetical protein
MSEPGTKTAFITGASSGIGEAFARRLARDGYDLILVARRKQLLFEIAQELSETFGVTVSIEPADLGRDEDVSRLEERVRGAGHLAMLINNAGFTTDAKSIEAGLEVQLDMIKVHDVATLRLIHAALPGMRARRAGAIINVASLAGMLPTPYNATYNATKSFLVALTEGLHQELAANGVRGIRVQALCPGYTHSGFHETAGASREVSERMWMTSEEVADESLAALEKGTVVFIPGGKNRLMVTLMLAVPRALRYRLARLVE